MELPQHLLIVDINLLFPLLAGFQASSEAISGDFEEPTSSPASRPDPQLRSHLEKLLEADRKDLEEEEGEVVEELFECMGPHWREAIAAGSRRNSVASLQRQMSESSSCDELQEKLREEERELRATKAHERAMEIDFQAKEALVQNLMEERSILKAKTQALTKQLESNVVERWLCGCAQLEAIAEALEEKEETAIKSEIAGVSELADGQVIIEGHFTGQMVTKAHFMELAMPLGATMPGVPVVELLRAMCNACGDEEDEAKRKRTEVISEVLALLEVDVLQEEQLATLEEEDATLAESDKDDEAAESRLHQMSKEIEALRSEQSRIQNEAEQLRMKNSTLATFLASAERSAMQLRSALTEAGINISDSPTSQGVRRGESRDLKEDLQ